MHNNRIAIIICYFGNFPWYTRLFLHSCESNSTIDFHFFSDNLDIQDLPKNVFYHHMSLTTLTELIAVKMGFDVNITVPYKLCDFKPAYGLIFEDYLGDYHFWGQCDIDVIYGDIREFLSDSFLDSIDFFSPRNDYATGCFTLFRNNNTMNTLFKRSKDFSFVFKNPDYYGFDEFNFQHHLLHPSGSVLQVKTSIETITHILKLQSFAGLFRAHFEFVLVEGLPGNICYNKGKLVYKKKYEVMFYHLYWFKRIVTNHLLPDRIPEVYFIHKSDIRFLNPAN